jgi:hypothetical protein
VKHTTITGYQNYIRKGGAPLYLFRKRESTDALQVQLGGPDQNLEGVFALSANVWYFIAYVRNVGTDTLKMYYATATGSMIEDVSATDATTGDHGVNGSDLTLGSDGFGNPVLGSVAHISIWSRALTPGELESVRWCRQVGPDRIGYWPFQGSSPEPDLSGSNKPGTVTGSSITDNPPVSGCR